MLERLLPPTEEEESRALAMSLEPEDEEVEITLEQEEEEGPSSIKGELQWNVRDSTEPFSDGVEKKMLTGLTSSEDEKNKNNEEEDGMVTLIVTIEEKLLRRIETSGYPNFATDPTTKAEEVEDEAPTKDEPG